MADFNGSKTLEEIEFSYIPIWVRVTNLPLGLLSKETGEIGEFMEADVGEDRMATGRFLRVKIRLDIRKPLMCGVTKRADPVPEAPTRVGSGEGNNRSKVLPPQKFALLKET
jgi:hypothetical protein